MLTESWVEGKSVEEKDAQPTERTAALWGLSSKIDSGIWVNFTRNGLRLGSRHQEPPPKNAHELKVTVKETWASMPPQQCHKLITPKNVFVYVYYLLTRVFEYLYTERNYKCNTCFCPNFSWAELKYLRLFLCTQKAYFSQILFTNLSKSVLVSTSPLPW